MDVALHLLEIGFALTGSFGKAVDGIVDLVQSVTAALDEFLL